MDLDCCFGAVSMRHLWSKNDRLPYCLYDAGVSVSDHVSGETASDLLLHFDCWMFCLFVFCDRFLLQWSFKLWRKIMYTFWVVVIGFAMLTLIMIYTYQFEGFSGYWQKYLKIDEDLYEWVLSAHRFHGKDNPNLFFQANGHRSGTLWNQRFVPSLSVSNAGRYHNGCATANFP